MEARRQIADRYAAGESAHVLAADFAVAKSTILKVLDGGGVTRRYASMTAADIARAAELYQEGRSLSQIQAILRFAHDTVRKAILSAGVQLRPPTGGRKNAAGSARTDDAR